METDKRIHFVRLTLAEYESLLEKEAADPDTLYFCSVSGKGFRLYLGEEALSIAPAE